MHISDSIFSSRPSDWYWYKSCHHQYFPTPYHSGSFSVLQQTISEWAGWTRIRQWLIFKLCLWSLSWDWTLVWCGNQWRIYLMIIVSIVEMWLRSRIRYCVSGMNKSEISDARFVSVTGLWCYWQSFYSWHLSYLLSLLNSPFSDSPLDLHH